MDAVDSGTSNLFLNPPKEKHIALLYDSKEKLNPAMADYINEGLRRGQFCVYATVYYRDEHHIEKFSTLIINYKENVEKGNLLVVDLAPFYISALLGDMKPFEDDKELFAERVKDRADKHVRFVGDGTAFLFRNKHFDECAAIEERWQDKPFEGSYVCPFEKKFFNAFPHDAHCERAIVVTHDVVVDIDCLPERGPIEDELNNQQQQLSSAQDIQGYNSNETRTDNGREST